MTMSLNFLKGGPREIFVKNTQLKILEKKGGFIVIPADVQVI